MELSLLTDVFKRYSLSDALSLARRAGFRAIELNACFDWSPHIDFTRADAEAQVEQLGRDLEQFDMRLAAVATYTNIASDSDVAREQAVAYCERAIQSLSALDCPVITLMTSGSNLLPFPPQYKALCESLRRLSDVAGDRMQIAIEVYPGNFIESTERVLDLIADLDLGNVGYLLCVPHLAALGEDITAAYTRARDVVNHIHLADTPLATDSHLHLVPGTGEIEFGSFFDLLCRDDYRGCLSLQIYSHEETAFDSSRRSLEVVKEWLATAGRGLEEGP